MTDLLNKLSKNKNISPSTESWSWSDRGRETIQKSIFRVE